MIRKVAGHVLSVWLVGLVSVGTAYAHHSAAAEFDVNQAIQITGVLTKLEWINPHVQMHFDVKEANGQTNSWTVEFVSVGSLLHAGLTKSSMTVGDTYTLVINPARDGRKVGLSNIVTFPNGRVYRLAGEEYAK